MLANLPSDRDWNNEGLVAGDRCYHSSARLGGVRLSLPATWGPLTGLENSVWLCVWLCVCDSVCVPLNGCGAKYKRWKEWLCFHAKPHSVHSKCRYQHVDKKREACTGVADRQGDGESSRLHDTRSFLAGNYTLWRGQILSVDPWCWNFLAKPQEANWSHCRSATTGIEPETLRSERATSPKLERERGVSM